MESGLVENFKTSWLNHPATEKFLNQKQELDIIKSIQYHNTVPIKNEKINVIIFIVIIDLGWLDISITKRIISINKLIIA